MESSITEQLRDTFALASLRNKASHFRSPKDWERGLAIINRYKSHTEELENNYHAEYDSRINRVLKQLIDKAGAKDLSFKHRWFGTDNFNKSTLTRQAHQIVQNKHQERINYLNKRESTELRTLDNEIEQRDQLQGKPTQDFERSATRRSGIERRSPNRTR